MNTYNLPDLSQDSPKKWENLSHNNCYVITYHNSLSAVKCPRCGKSGELIEDGLIRCLYQCRSCGIFSKIKPKPKRLHGLTQLIAQGELTTDALNLYRGDTDGIAGTDSQDDQKEGHGNAGDDSQRNQKTTAIITRCGFVLFEN